VQRIELHTAPGVYAATNLYIPRGLTRPAAAILIVFGHGDRLQGYQAVASAFVRQGYVVMTIEPYGGGETGEAHPWNDYHGGMPSAALTASGHPLNGLVVYNHLRALDYLCSRPEVDASRLGVTGVSGGGTHSMWLAACDGRVAAAVSGANPWVTRPDWYFRHHCSCDTVPGLFQFADEDTLVAAACPAAFLRIHLAPEVADFTHEQLRAKQAPAHAVYAAAGAAERVSMAVVDSPHAYSPQVQNAASDWFGRWLGPLETPTPRPDLPSEPSDPDALLIWPQGRPADILTPTQFAQRAIRGKLEALPKTAQSDSQARNLSDRTRDRLLDILGCRDAATGEARTLGLEELDGVTVRRMTLDSDGLTVPFVVVRPTVAVRPPVALLLHSGGKSAIRKWALATALLQAGWSVLAPDLLDQGEIRGDFESSNYLGSRDQETCTAAMVVGQSLAGWWSQEVLALVGWAQAQADLDASTVACVAQGETGLALLAAAAQSDALRPLVFTGTLASYHSAEGYGKPYVYGGDNSSIGGVGSNAWYVPDIVSAGDVDQFVGLLVPRPVMVACPVIASGRTLSAGELAGHFTCSRSLWAAAELDNLRIVSGRNTARIAQWLDRMRGGTDSRP
jgi:dienelactone hydrolase